MNMKFLQNLFRVFLILIAFNNAYSLNDTVKCNAINFQVTASNTKFSFDVYILRITPGNFRMGNSSFFLNFHPGALTNAVLSNVNPRYTAGDPSYTAMEVATYNTLSKVAVQIHFDPSGAGGEIISNVPGDSGVGWRYA